MFRWFTCLFALLLLRFCCVAQQGVDFIFDDQPSTARQLSQYLRTPDSAEAKIRQLLAEIEQYPQRHDYLSTLNNLLLALTLEAAAPKNTLTTYNLNRIMGSVVADLNPQYALHFQKKAIAISNVLPSKAVGANNLQLMGSIAGLHIRLSETDSALHWYRLAIAEVRTNHSNIAQASAYNNLGVFYAGTGRYDSAMYYFKTALEAQGCIEPDTVLYCSIQDNIAQEQERQGNFANALHTYRFNDSVYTNQKKYVRIVLNRIRLLNAERKSGLRTVGKGIENLHEFIVQNRKNLNGSESLQFYEFAKVCFFETGSLAAARRYDSLYTAVKDSLVLKNKARTDLIANAFLQVQAIRFQRDAEVFRLESAAARQMILWLMLVGAIGSGLVLFFMHKRRQELAMAHRLTVAELRSKELESLAMAQAIEFQKRDITTVVLHNTQVLDNRRRMIDRLTEIARQKNNPGEAIHALITELQVQEHVSDRTRMEQENIDRVNAEFYQMLLNQFPALSKAEVELCGYLRVDLTSKDIAILKNIAPASVKMSKNRLRKKLGLGAADDLYAFVQGIKNGL